MSEQQTAPIFAEQFDRFVCDGDKITAEHDGFTVVAFVERDGDHGAPWDEECGHGPVSKWRNRHHSRSYDYRNTGKAPGEMVLSNDRDSYRFYDFAEATRIAKRDGWGLAPETIEALSQKLGRKPTAKQITREAVLSDFRAMKAWCNDEWDYCGVCVVVTKNGVRLTDKYDHALWGIERNYPAPGDQQNSYLAEVANELVGEALDAARDKLASLCDCGHELETELEDA